MNEILSFTVAITPMTLIIAAGVLGAALIFAGTNVRISRLNETIKRKDFGFAPKHSERDGSLQWSVPVYDCWTGRLSRA